MMLYALKNRMGDKFLLIKDEVTNVPNGTGRPGLSEAGPGLSEFAEI